MQLDQIANKKMEMKNYEMYYLPFLNIIKNGNQKPELIYIKQ